jgi:hypothetical protein
MGGAFMGTDKTRALDDGHTLDAPIHDWLDIFQGAEAPAAKQTQPSLPFAEWCCLPLVALAVLGDILFQFMR